jgi:transcription elongation factor Elf1
MTGILSRAQLDAFSMRMSEAKTRLFASGDYSDRFVCPICGADVICTLDRRKQVITAICETGGCLGMQKS